MAALRPRVIGAIIRKDFISLWPLVIGAGLLPLCMVGDLLVDVANPVKVLLVAIGILATAALALSVFHQDAVASVRHDALTRPIGGFALVVAKLIFLFFTVALPICGAQFARELIRDHTLAEAGLSALALLSIGVLAAVPVVVLALVTASLVQAFVMVFSLVILSVLTSLVVPAASGDGGAGQWTADMLCALVVAAFAIGILILLFRRRSPRLAQGFYVAAFVSVLAFNYLPHEASAAMQGVLLPSQPRSSTLKTSVQATCAKDRSLKSAVTMAELTASGIPAGSQVVIDRIRADRVTADGRVIEGGAGWAEAPKSVGVDVRGWRVLVPVTSTDPEARLRWSYTLTWLKAIATQDMPADGKRRHLPGFGYCESMTSPRGEIGVNCFKPFSQPAAISAELVGQPSSFCFSCSEISYRPALLEGFGASRHVATKGKAPGANQTVRLIAYEPSWQASRQVTTPANVPTCGPDKT